MTDTTRDYHSIFASPQPLRVWPRWPIASILVSSLAIMIGVGVLAVVAFEHRNAYAWSSVRLWWLVVCGPLSLAALVIGVVAKFSRRTWGDENFHAAAWVLVGLQMVFWTGMVIWALMPDGGAQ